MRTCKDCRWFAYQRNPETGRILPSQRGTCGYDIRAALNAVKLPMVYTVRTYWDSPFDTTNADDCQCFTPKAEKKPKVEVVTQDELTTDAIEMPRYLTGEEVEP